MLLLMGLIAAGVVVVITGTNSLSKVHSLGWMSDRWLAEHRASEHR